MEWVERKTRGGLGSYASRDSTCTSRLRGLRSSIRAINWSIQLGGLTVNAEVVRLHLSLSFQFPH